MTTGESFIGLILAIIAYLLYQIAKQLSFLTGKRIKFPFSQSFKLPKKKAEKAFPEEKPEKLPN